MDILAELEWHFLPAAGTTPNRIATERSYRKLGLKMAGGRQAGLL